MGLGAKPRLLRRCCREAAASFNQNCKFPNDFCRLKDPHPVKWTGRNVSGGLFGVQSQTNYTQLANDPRHPEHHLFVNTLITKDLTDRWTIGTNLPLVYKYMHDPYDVGVDLSNGGLGEVSFLISRKLGPINATTLTATVGVPTGVYDVQYKMKILPEHQQTGFGTTTASLMLDHTFDQVWGLVVLGGVAAWRGGENQVNNYRAPSATGYFYTGYFFGPFVPAVGLSASGFAAHDRDQTVVETTPLASAAANVSVEWSTDWLAVLVGASLPYQYDGILADADGRPRSPWGWGPWVVALGFSFAPF